MPLLVLEGGDRLWSSKVWAGALGRRDGGRQDDLGDRNFLSL
jgi:hypothetical protein